MRKLVLFLNVLSAAVPMHGMDYESKRLADRSLFYDSNNEFREGYSLLHVSAMLGDVKGIEKALLKESIQSKSAWSGYTALHTAALYGQDASVSYLLSCGADINAQDELGETPFQVACKNGNYETAKLLKQYTAD